MGTDWEAWSELVVGADLSVGLSDGTQMRYVNFDNAASTPALQSVVELLERVLPWYASVHRGAGIKSRVMTELYENVRSQVLGFVGARPETHDVVFTRNTTEALNVFSHIAAKRGWHIVTTAMEHHSNMLPWRRLSDLTVVPVSGGVADLSALEDALRLHPGERTVVAVTGASNVTGAVLPIGEISRLARRHDARLLVDGAQLVAHRAVHMERDAIDALAFSGHKIYAPFGAGALVLRREWLADVEPLLLGGGIAELVTSTEILFSAGAARHEGGSPNVLGVLAMGEALASMGRLGLDAVAAHEAALVDHLYAQLSGIPGLRLYGVVGHDRVGVVPFTVDGVAPGLVAEVLGREWAIGVRSGCFCAHPYVMQLLHLDEEEMARNARLTGGRGWRGDQGLVRVSFGLYNTEGEIDRLAAALQGMATGEIPQGYWLGPDGNYHSPHEEEWVRAHADGLLQVGTL